MLSSGRVVPWSSVSVVVHRPAGATEVGFRTLQPIAPEIGDSLTLTVRDMAIPLTIVAGTGHLLMGNVDLGLLGNLLLGSVPGVIVGSLLGAKVPEKLLRTLIALVLVAVGLKLVL